MSEVKQIRLVGRVPELTRLTSELRLFADRSTQCSKLVTVSGEPGIGKTRLLRECLAALDDEEIQSIETSCAPHGPAHPWHPVRTLIAQLAGMEPSMVPEERLLKLNGLRESHGIPDEALDAARHLLSLPTDDASWPDMGASARRMRLRSAVTDLIKHLSRERPLVFVIEDLHWVDPETLQWLDAFLQDQSDQSALVAPQVMVMALHRPTFGHLWPSRAKRLDFRLEPLDQRASTQLLHEIFHLAAGVPKRLIQQLHERTGGNPFYMEEAVHLLVDRGDLVEQEDGSLGLTGDTLTIDLPTSPTGLVDERLQRLERRLKSLLQCASVIGHEVRLDLLHHLNSTVDQAELPLESLVDEKMLERRDSLEGLTLLFRHAITREVTYDSLLRGQRSELHGKLGLHLEELHREHLEESAELLAYHFGASDLPEKAITYLQLAARQAKRLCSHEAALHHLTRLSEILDQHGHALTNPRDLRAWTALERGRLERLAGHFESACDLLREAAEVNAPEEPTALHVQVLRAWGETERQRGAADVAIELHRRALRACEALVVTAPGAVSDGERVNTLLALGVSQRVRGDLNDALPTLEEAERRARRLGDTRSIASALNNGGICRLARGEFHEAHAPLRSALDLLREIGDQRNLVGCLNNMGIVLDRLLELDQALDVYAESLRLAYEIGHRRAILANHVNAGQLLQWLDNHEEAARHFNRVIEHCRTQPDAVAEGLARVNLAFSHFHCHRLEGCAEELSEAERVAESVRDHTLSIHCALLRSQLTLAQSDPERAEKAASAALHLIEEAGEGDEHAWAVRLRGLALCHADDPVHGHRLLTDALRESQRRGDSREQILSQIALARAMRHRRRPVAQRRHARRAQSLLARHPIPLLQRSLEEVTSA